MIISIIGSIWIIYPITLSQDKNAELITVTFHISPDIRAILRKTALNISLKNPFFGIGQGMFTYELKNYIDLNAARNTLKINNFNLLEIDPHCSYFGTIAETGFIGFLAILIVFYSVMSASLKSIKESPQSKYRNIAIYLFVSLIGYFITAWFMDIFTLRQFWINAALLIGASSILKNKNGE